VPKNKNPFEFIEVSVVDDEEEISAEELALIERHLADVLKAVIALVNIEEE